MLKSFVVRNLQLYLCWFVIWLPLTIYYQRDSYFTLSTLEQLWGFFSNLIFDGTFVASWFLPATIWGVLIIYFLSRALKNNVIILVIAFFSFCVVTLFSSYETVIEHTFVMTAVDCYQMIFGDLLYGFPAALLWICLGKLIAQEKIKIRSVGLLIFFIIVSGVSLYLEWKFVMNLDGSYNNDSYFMLAPLCVLLFLGIQKLKPINWKPSVHFKRASTIIYVAHGTLLPMVAKGTSMVFKIKSVPLIFVLTFLCCIGIYVFIEMMIKIFPARAIKKVLKMLY